MTHVDARGVTCAVVAVGDASAGARAERSVLDATGQVVASIDARGLVAFTYVRDLRGRPLAQTSVDAGPTWALADAYDRPVWTVPMEEVARLVADKIKGNLHDQAWKYADEITRRMRGGQ